LLGSPYLQTLTLAADVQSFQVSVTPSTPLTRLVGVELAAGQGNETLTLRGATALRAAVTQYVAMAGGQYVLNMP